LTGKNKSSESSKKELAKNIKSMAKKIKKNPPKGRVFKT